MKQSEYGASQQDAITAAIDGRVAEIWTCLPCVVDSFDAQAQTITASPLILIDFVDDKGARTPTQIAQLLDVPILPMRAGGCSITVPVKKGDECLVFFATRCINLWWAQGGFQRQEEYRLHDLSDGFAYFGPSNKTRTIPAYSTDEVQIRSDDGSASIAINPETKRVRVYTTGNLVADARGNVDVVAGGDAKVIASGGLIVTAASITLNGPVQINGAVNVAGSVTASGDVAGSNKSLAQHTHPTPDGESGPPS